MNLDIIIELLLNEVRDDLLSREAVYAMEEQSLWDDFGIEAHTGLPHQLSSPLVDHVDELLVSALSELPIIVQHGLWLLSLPGQDFLFEVGYALEHERGSISELHLQANNEAEQTGLYLRGLLLKRAEADRNNKQIEECE